jgi:signal transduction histidine kinase
MKALATDTSQLLPSRQDASVNGDQHPDGMIRTHDDRTMSHTRRTTTVDHPHSEPALRFLIEISSDFVARDSETTLKRLALGSVPFLADFCLIDIISSDGALHRASFACADGIDRLLFDALVDFVSSVSSADHAVARVSRTGVPVFVPEVTDVWMTGAAVGDRYSELMRELEVCSLIAVPLLAAEGTLGVLTYCYTRASARHHRLDELWLAEDLARRAALVIENARLYQALEDAADRKDEFLAILGHELRNPLAAIRNAMHVFRTQRALDSTREEVAGMVERQVAQLTRLVDDLFDVSRGGQGTIRVKLDPIDLREVVTLAVEASRPLIEARSHVLTVSIPSEVIEVEGDRGRLAQVISNLLNNSAKYTDDGGAIHLTLEATGEDAVVCVTDTGVGIEPSMLPTVFDLFARVRNAAGRLTEGLGIGLALVRNIVDLHGGRVRATSAGLGQGTAFTVYLPLLHARKAGDSGLAEHPTSAAAARARRILLVDDNRDAADSMALLLGFDGHEVRTAYDGHTALALARLQPPDVVICDISMPYMGGLELAPILRQEPGMKDSFLVALSGYAQADDRFRSLEAGFNVHLAKPVRFENLKAMLAS